MFCREPSIREETPLVIKFMRFDFGFLRQIGGRTAAFLSDGSGNVAITLAVCLVPMMLAVGASLDYTRAYNVQCEIYRPHRIS